MARLNIDSSGVNGPATKDNVSEMTFRLIGGDMFRIVTYRWDETYGGKTNEREVVLTIPMSSAEKVAFWDDHKVATLAALETALS